MTDRKARHYAKSKKYYTSSQEEWIKTYVKKSARTQCTQCNKWISKYWMTGTDYNYVMTKCGLCYFGGDK